MNRPVAIVWFRQDLRLADHPALHAAIASGSAIVPVYISPPPPPPMPSPHASDVWKYQAIEHLDQQLRQRGSRLILRAGDAQEQMLELVRQTQASSVWWTRRYDPSGVAVDKSIEQKLTAMGVAVENRNGGLLAEPWDIQTGQGKPYQVYTPFYRACLSRLVVQLAHQPPTSIAAPASWPASLKLQDLRLMPVLPWEQRILDHWQPERLHAGDRLKAFLRQAIDGYDTDRDRMDLDGTSILSPFLACGQISPRTIWHEVRQRAGGRLADVGRGAEVYLKQIIWREFAYHLLHHYPKTIGRALRPAFDQMPWRNDPEGLAAWQRGQTGYPIVDAGMRQLWATGWMHNRARMIVASFLVKDLLIDWRHGAAWFMDTLVDADLANNTLGWQWVAGGGADAAPFFRIFNPVTQGQKFDPDGAYVRRWVPELAKLDRRWIQAPWQASPLALAEAKIRLGKDYPMPMVDHAQARLRALAALASVKSVD